MTRNEFTEAQLKWLDELENGNHSQTHCRLKKDDGYCCLGIAMQFVLGYEPQRRGLGYYFGPEESTGALDKAAVSLLDMHNDMGIARACHGKYYPSLYGMNDSGKSFKEIAAAIRATPWAYFTNFDVPVGA